MPDDKVRDENRRALPRLVASTAFLCAFEIVVLGGLVFWAVPGMTAVGWGMLLAAIILPASVTVLTARQTGSLPWTLALACLSALLLVPVFALWYGYSVSASGDDLVAGIFLYFLAPPAGFSAAAGGALGLWLGQAAGQKRRRGVLVMVLAALPLAAVSLAVSLKAFGVGAGWAA